MPRLPQVPGRSLPLQSIFNNRTVQLLRPCPVISPHATGFVIDQRKFYRGDLFGSLHGFHSRYLVGMGLKLKLVAPLVPRLGGAQKGGRDGPR